MWKSCFSYQYNEPIWRLSWSHPKYDSLLASCSYDGSVKVFSISKDKSYNVVYSFTGHKASGKFRISIFSSS